MATQNKQIESGKYEGVTHWLLSVAFALAISVSSARAEVKRDCFEEHMSDAIASNLARTPLYESASQGRSTKISRRMIFLERAAKLSSQVYYHFDYRAQFYQARGVNIMCDEFMPMSNSPAFANVSETPWPKLSEYERPDGARISRVLKAAYRTGDMNAFYRVTVQEIERLDRQPKFNCMLRHLLESIARGARLAPVHVANATKLGLESPIAISNDFIKSQFLVIESSIDLDETAAPLQADGIAIICNDVPAIPY